MDVLTGAFLEEWFLLVLLLLAFSLILVRGGYVFVATRVHIAELLLWFEFNLSGVFELAFIDSLTFIVSLSLYIITESIFFLL